jgi:2'-5' RNA ligase
MQRLFIAIDLPPLIREQIADICFGVREARWVPTTQMHLTLRFIGEVDGRLFDEIRSGLDRVRAVPFEFSLKSTGFFPLRGSPRVLWVGVEPCAGLQALVAIVERLLERIGLPRESRKFHPHITVARIGQAIDPSAVAPFVIANSLFRAGPVMVDALHLYSSVLQPEGALHRLEASYSLNP